MDRNNCGNSKNLGSYTESDLNALLLEIELLESKASDVKDTYNRLKDYNNKLKDLSIEKEFELRKVQTKRKYLDISIELGKEEFELKTRELEEKRYSLQRLLDLSNCINAVISGHNVKKVCLELSSSYTELKDMIHRSEQAREVSRIDCENVKLEDTKNALESEIEELRSRLEYVKNEVSKQEQNNVHKWIVEMSTLAIEEKRLYKILKERTNEAESVGSRLTKKTCELSNALNTSLLPLPDSQLSSVSNWRVPTNQVNSFGNGDNDNASITFSHRSSQKRQKNKISSLVFNTNSSSMKCMNDINKLINDSIAESQCSIISTEEPDVCINNSKNDCMEFESILHNNLAKSKLNSDALYTPSNHLNSNPEKRAELTSKDSVIEDLLNTTNDSLGKHNDKPMISSNFETSDIFASGCEESDAEEHSLPDIENMIEEHSLPDIENMIEEQGDLSKLNFDFPNISDNLSNIEMDFTMDINEKTDDTFKKVIFDRAIDIMEITPHKDSNEKSSEDDKVENIFDTKDFHGDFDADSESIFDFLNTSKITVENDSSSDEDKDLRIDLNSYAVEPDQNQLELLDEQILDVLRDQSNDNNDTDNFDKMFNCENFFGS